MTLEKKKITVIMGLFNCEKTLEESINCLIQQTYKDWNLIMCDDGSIDNTYNIAQNIASKYPKQILLIKNERNMGLNFTLNKCLKLANGEYIARMDADDVCDNKRFEKEICILDNNPQYAFVSSPMILFDENGEWGCDWGIEKPEAKDLIKSRPFCHAACMIRKKVFLDVGGYTVDEKLLRVEDLHLWMKLYEKGYLGYNIQEPLYKMRDDRNAYSRRKFKYRINESYVNYLTVKKLKLPMFYYIYAIRPILVGLMPNKLYDLLHKLRLGKD